MPKPHRRLTRAQVVRALTRLGEFCATAQIRAEIAIYGGTVMMIAYDFREATKDVDYYGDRGLENGKRWLVEKLIAEVRREEKAAK